MSKSKDGSSTAEASTEARPATSRLPMEDSTVDAPPAVPGAMEYDYTNFYFGSGSDAFALLEPFDD